MLIFWIWFIGSIFVGVAAGSRGRNAFGWFLLAAIFSPLLTVILLVLMPVRAVIAPVQLPAPTPLTLVVVGLLALGIYTNRASNGTQVADLAPIPTDCNAGDCYSGRKTAAQEEAEVSCGSGGCSHPSPLPIVGPVPAGLQEKIFKCMNDLDVPHALLHEEGFVHCSDGSALQDAILDTYFVAPDSAEQISQYRAEAKVKGY